MLCHYYGIKSVKRVKNIFKLTVFKFSNKNHVDTRTSTNIFFVNLSIYFRYELSNGFHIRAEKLISNVVAMDEMSSILIIRIKFRNFISK